MKQMILKSSQLSKWNIFKEEMPSFKENLWYKKALVIFTPHSNNDQTLFISYASGITSKPYVESFVLTENPDPIYSKSVIKNLLILARRDGGEKISVKT